MKYSVEYKEGAFIETLEVDSHIVTKAWKREKPENSAISGLCSSDKEFSEQLFEVFDEDVCEKIYDFFDNSVLVADMEDFIIDTGVE